MKVFTADYISDLTRLARDSNRQRQHSNLHMSYLEPCQRLFNAIEPASYIRPHLNSAAQLNELLLAVRGLLALITFDDRGVVTGVVKFGTEKFGSGLSVGAEVTVDTWHTVIALVPGSVLLEAKAGPFDPNQPKILAPWAPDEHSEGVTEYMQYLHNIVKSR